MDYILPTLRKIVMSQAQDGTPILQNEPSITEGSLEDIQHKLIVEHYRNPRNNHSLINPDIQTTEANPFCGDETTIQVRINGDILEEIGIQAVGCSICQASLSMLSEAVQNLTLTGAASLSSTFQRMMLGENLNSKEILLLGDLASLVVVRKYPIRIKCALLAWVALDLGLSDYQTKT